MNQASVQSSAAPPAVAALVRGWHRLECVVAFAAFCFVAVLAIYDVVARELLAPLIAATGVYGLDPASIIVPGSTKLAVYALIIGAFCGLGMATATGAQLVPKVAFGWVPASWAAVMPRVADAFTAAVLVGVMVVGWVFVLSSKAAGMLLSGGIEIQAWILQTAIPLGFASAAVRYAIYAVWPALRPMAPEFQE